MTGYERLLDNEEYCGYYIVNDEGIAQGGFVDEGYPHDSAIYDTANYYSNEIVAKNNARADELMRKLRRFAVEHNEYEIDWEDDNQYKFYIEYDHLIQKIEINKGQFIRKFGQIYFSSIAIAEQAIEEYRDDLLWYFTEYCDHAIEVETEECEYCGNTEKLQAMKILGFKCCYECGRELEARN